MKLKPQGPQREWAPKQFRTINELTLMAPDQEKGLLKYY